MIRLVPVPGGFVQCCLPEDLDHLVHEPVSNRVVERNGILGAVGAHVLRQSLLMVGVRLRDGERCRGVGSALAGRSFCAWWRVNSWRAALFTNE
jgi:hypothetical protein